MSLSGERATVAGLVLGALAACQALLDFKESNPASTADGGERDAALEVGSPALDAGGDAEPCDATFCDDFDHGALGARWDSKSFFPEGGVPGLVMELVEGAPESGMAMRIDVPANTATSRGAGLDQKLGDGDVVTCEFDLFIENKTMEAPQHIDILTLGAAGADVTLGQLYFAIKGDPPTIEVREDLWYSDGGGDTPKPDTARTFTNPTVGWNRIKLETDFSTFSLWYGPTEMAKAYPLRGFSPSKIRVTLSMWSYRSSPSAARFDNFTCTVANRRDGGR